jgi:formylglycine-generating enzyme required for sulfatase activity/uncharacterized caspase-like protein
VRIARIIAVAGLMLIGAIVPAHAEKRVALVVGNAAYVSADKLANPVKDARSMRDVLTALRFDVIYGEDLDLKGLRRAIGRFAGRAEGADVAIVYFAGHGATFGDTPYVVPIDAEFSSVDEVAYELVPVETLIGELRRAKGVRIAILDACRDNAAERELKRRTAAARGGEMTRGLGPMKSPSGLIIAYATQYLSTASDDVGGADAGGLFSLSKSSTRHSPFTAALLNNIATPGLDVTEMFRRVGREVDATTGGRQRPEISISMYEQYALVPVGAGPATAPLGESQPGAAALPDATPGVAAAVAAPAASSLPAESKPAHTSPTRPAASLPDATPVASAAASAPVASSLPAPPQPVQPVPIPPDAGTKESAAHVPAPGPAKSPSGQQTAAVAPPVTPNAPDADPCSGPVTASFASRCTAPLTAAQERGLKPQDAFRECDKCPEMVMVPAGRFDMGAPKEEENATFSEVPQHRVALAQALAAGRFAVTFDEWDACVAAGGCNGYRPDDKGWGRGRQAVINVAWSDAKAYVAWLSARTGKTYRLLSEAEREYVTRAGTTTPFWWGSSISTKQANYNGDYVYGRSGAKGEFRQRTLPVDSFRPNPWGFYQVHGNVFEWTEDCAHTYSSAPSDGAAWTPAGCRSRVVRGGSWYSNPTDLRATYRQSRSSSTRSNDVGFRVGRTLLTSPVSEQATRR